MSSQTHRLLQVSVRCVFASKLCLELRNSVAFNAIEEEMPSQEEEWLCETAFLWLAVHLDEVDEDIVGKLPLYTVIIIYLMHIDVVSVRW